MKGPLSKEKEIQQVEIQKFRGATVEEALDVTGFGKYNYGLLLVCSWTLQAMGLDLFGTSFTVGAAVCDLDLSMHERAFLTATPLIGVVAGAQLWGYISDTKGRRLTLILSMSIGFIFASLSSLSPNWQTMSALKFISSTFTSATNSGAYTLLGESCNSRSRGRVMLLCTCALMSAQAVAAVFAYPILPLQFSYWIDFLGISFRPWRLLVLVLAAPCAITAGLLHLFYESPKFLASRGRYEEALDVLSKIYASNTGDKAENYPIKKLLVDDVEDSSASGTCSFLCAMWQQTVPLFKAPHLKRTLQLFYLVIIIYMTGSGFIMWLPYIMNHLFTVLEAGVNENMNLCTIMKVSIHNTYIVKDNSTMPACDDTIQETAILSAIIYGALAGFANLVLSLTSGSRKRIAMLFILSMSASSAILINVITIPIAGGIFFFFFMMCALSMGILSVYFVELYPTSLRGMVSCLSVMVGRSSAFFGVNAIGALLSTNCEATFYGWSILLMNSIATSENVSPSLLNLHEGSVFDLNISTCNGDSVLEEKCNNIYVVSPKRQKADPVKI